MSSRQAQNQFNPASLRVLVVDDQDYMRSIIAEVLRGAGVRDIVGAPNAFDALQEMEKRPPDLVITDWSMDGMDGGEMTRTVRNSGKSIRAVPIIMMSGDSRRSQIDLARQCGVDEYIVKPVSSHSVVSRIQHLVRRPRIFIDSASYTGPCRRRTAIDMNGPLRRLNDPIATIAPEGVEHQRVAAECIARAHDVALDLDPTDRAKLREIFHEAQGATAAALSSTDRHLARAAKSLLRYVEGMGASGRMQADVVGTHLDAIQKIIALPPRFIEEREVLTQGLERVVTKKLQAA